MFPAQHVLTYTAAEIAINSDWRKEYLRLILKGINENSQKAKIGQNC